MLPWLHTAFNSVAGDGDVWLANDATTVYSDTAATSPAAEDDPVGAWLGKVNGKQFSQHGTAPLLRADGRIEMADATSGLEAPEPLMPDDSESADYTMIFGGQSHATDRNRVRLVTQYLSGALGRQALILNYGQILPNAIYVDIPGRAYPVMNTVKDSGSYNGLDETAPIDPGVLRPFVVTIRWRAGTDMSEIRVNGSVIDRFTAPTSVMQGINTRLLVSSDYAATGLASVGMFWSKKAYLDDANVEAIEQAYLTEKAWTYPDPVVAPYTAGIGSCTMRVSDGALITARGHYNPGPHSSMTKMQTSILAGRWITDWDEEFPANTTAYIGDSPLFSNGDIVTPRALMYMLVIPSDNAAGFTLAEFIGDKILASEGATGDGLARFYVEFDALLGELGMYNTLTPNPSGWPDSPAHLGRPAGPNQRSIAIDQCLVLRELMQNPAQNAVFLDAWSLYTKTVQVIKSGVVTDVVCSRSSNSTIDRADVLGGKGGGNGSIFTYGVGWCSAT